MKTNWHQRYRLSRVIAILKRWRDVLAYAVLGAVTAAVVAPRLDQFITRNSDEVLSNSPLALAILLLLAALAFHRFAATRLDHLRYILRYPPLPVAVVVGLITLPLIKPLHGTPLYPLGSGALATCGFAAAWLLYGGIRFLSERISARWVFSQEQPHDDEAKLKNWLAREEPISDPQADMFGLAFVAERLVERLSATETTIALQGHFGAGKTSIGAMAETIAERQRKPLIFAHVSCWGFGQSADAQEELLSEIVRATTKHVDTFAVRQLPAHYVGAVGGSSDWASVLARLVFGKRQPVRVLQDLSPILLAIGKRLVIFVEDVDRNFPSFDITQIEALLVRLREVRGLSFVLCVSPTLAIDLDRMCDYTEIIPPLDRVATLKLIHSVRESLLREYAPNVVLHALQPLLLDEDGYKLIASSLDYYWPWQFVLHTLLRTPRMLKRALHRVSAAWPTLCGEVHIDDLISISTLRQGAPRAFSFFVKNYSLFRSAGKETPHLRDEARTKVKETLQAEWQEITADKSFDARAAAWLMKELFPASGVITGVSGVYSRHHQTMQSGRRGEIYARRLLTESVAGEEITDQRILTLIRDAESDDQRLSELAQAITDSKFASDAFEEFAQHLRFTRFFPLLSNVYLAIRRRHTRTKYSRDDYPGFFAPWRLINDNRPAGFEDWLPGELGKCIPTDLRLMTDIYYFWLGTDRHTFEERRRSREVIHKALRESWSSMPAARIPDGFDPSHPYTLFHVIFTSDYLKPEAVPLGEIDDWLWTAGPLIEAARTQPQTMLPQIVIALNQETNRGREVPRFAFEESRLKKWFGRSVNELLELIARGFEVPDETDSRDRYLMLEAIDEARKMLAERNSIDSDSGCEPTESAPAFSDCRGDNMDIVTTSGDQNGD
jgi:hypothetical protein